ncbi:MAG: HEPN domain-containing protein [Candidatus Omnitrophica bacterium]|nr:HEPN domain-containing protein [Candidatus Omnitrophota bacterium]
MYPQDWLRIAAEDFRRVARRLVEGDTEDAAFRLQQALEKFLKGYLLSKGWTLKRTHDLELLLDDAIRYAPNLERHRRVCQDVTGYYFVERYPTFEEGPSSKDVKVAYAQAKALVRRLTVQSASKKTGRRHQHA